MKRLLDLFGVLVLVLLLSAFDERGAQQTVVRAKAGLDDVWTRLSPRAEPPATGLPTEAVDNGLRGQFAAVDDRSPWTLLMAEGAELDIAGLGRMQTRPLRIADASEPPLASLRLPAGHQVELREIVALEPAPGGQALCPEYPARYLALASRGDRLELAAFADVPEGEARPCSRLSFRLP